ncbi:MAG: glutaredoxin family protein [bacterium]|nr:glutaredoxin family protein [bacterium]
MDSVSSAVKIYSTTWCAYCHMVKEYLNKLNVPFQEIDIEKDQKAAEYIMGKTHSAGVPQIEIGDEVIIGFDRPRIDQALKDKHLVS